MNLKSRRFTVRLRCVQSLFLCAILSVGDAVGKEEERFQVDRGLAFSSATPTLTLDLYRPRPKAEQVPCIIVIQGGGFAPQNGQRFKAFAEHLANAGYAAALISYRGRPMHQYQDTLADVKDAARFIRKNAGAFGVDASRLGATGRSAGGTLAALIAVTAESPDDPSRVQAAVCFAGVFDFIGRFTHEEQLKIQPNHATKMKTNGEWIGAPFAVDNRDWIRASAIRQVDSEDPPILLLHARNDGVVPWQQSRDMHQKMKQAGIASELLVYEDGGHSVKPENRDSLDDMVDFFDRKLKRSSSSSKPSSSGN